MGAGSGMFYGRTPARLSWLARVRSARSRVFPRSAQRQGARFTQPAAHPVRRRLPGLAPWRIRLAKPSLGWLSGLARALWRPVVAAADTWLGTHEPFMSVGRAWCVRRQLRRCCTRCNTRRTTRRLMPVCGAASAFVLRVAGRPHGRLKRCSTVEHPSRTTRLATGAQLGAGPGQGASMTDPKPRRGRPETCVFYRRTPAKRKGARRPLARTSERERPECRQSKNLPSSSSSRFSLSADRAPALKRSVTLPRASLSQEPTTLPPCV